MRRLVLALVACSALPCLAAEPAAFPRTTIDLGCVVSDLDASVRFYTEGIGFRTLPGFSVEAPLAADAGLTDAKRLDVTVLVLGEGEQATRLKLMQVEGTARGGATTSSSTRTPASATSRSWWPTPTPPWPGWRNSASSHSRSHPWPCPTSSVRTCS